MKKTRKKHPLRNAVFLGIVAVLAITAGIYSYFGGFGTGECADAEEFSKYATAVSELTIPEQTQIVALGEATHGNAEFQRLKLDVFQILVERYGVRAFALEGDFGGCEAVNRYIHGGEGTAAEAAAAIGFAIYRTQEMEDLITWMRSYNETANPGEDLCFYGFDMQRYEYSYRYLLEAGREAGIDTAKLEELWDGETDAYADCYPSDQRAEIFNAVKNELPAGHAQAIHFTDVLLQNIELGKYTDDAGTGNARRDQMMAENTMWILGQEQARGNRCIFISGHNGHVEQFGSYGQGSKVMGNLLADALGDEYFVIGTDFYKTSCNLPKGTDGKRLHHTFYSYDPLAKASKECGFAESYLDFSTIPQGSILKEQAKAYTWMGTLGDGYNPLVMRILPASYRAWRSPATIYDAMIFVADAHPTEIKTMPFAPLNEFGYATHQTEQQNEEEVSADDTSSSINGDEVSEEGSAPTGKDEASEEELWKAALAEDLFEKYGVLPEYYEDLGDGIYQVYVEVGGEIVPFVTVDSATGDYHG